LPFHVYTVQERDIKVCGSLAPSTLQPISDIDYLPIYIFVNAEQLLREQYNKKKHRNYVALETEQCLAITEKRKIAD